MRRTNRRDHILSAAEELFRDQGYLQVPLAAIAARAGVTQAGVLHHFQSKDNLFIEVLSQRDAALPAHGLALMQHLVDTVVTNQSRPGIVQGFTVLAAESVIPGHPGSDYFRQRYATLREQVSAEIVSMIASGLVESTVAPDIAATCLIALLDGLQVQWLHDPGSLSMATDAADGIEALLRLTPGSLTRP